MADESQIAGQGFYVPAQPEGFRARKRWRKPSFTTLRRLHRLALRLWVRIPNPVTVAINSASAWPTREKRRVTKEACNRIKRRAVTAKAAPTRKVVSCSSFAAVGRFWASPRFPCPRLKSLPLASVQVHYFSEMKSSSFETTTGAAQHMFLIDTK